MPQRIMINSSAEAKTTGHPDVGDCVSSAVIQGLCSERAAVWFERRAYERAESQYYIRLQERQNGTTSAASTSNSHYSQENALTRAIFNQSPKLPDSLTAPRSLQLLPNSPSTHMLCDEGYLSQTPTPPTPASGPINGLPFVPAFLQGVWFQKPLYDRAEANFYQNLYHVNEPHSTPNEEQACHGTPHAAVTNKAKSDKTKEKKPGGDGVKKGSSALCHFLHADSERVWLDRCRYAEAETRFYKSVLTQTTCSLSSKYDVDICPHSRYTCPKTSMDGSQESKIGRALWVRRMSGTLLFSSVSHSNTNQSKVAVSSSMRKRVDSAFLQVRYAAL